MNQYLKSNLRFSFFCIFALYINYSLQAQVISTYAGIGPTGTWGSGSFSGDGGLATAAGLNGPGSVCIDKFENVYIADQSNYRIRKVDYLGNIKTIAGNGTATYMGDGIAATATGILPYYIRTDNKGNLFFSDGSSHLYKIDTAGVISTYAGTGTIGYTGDGGPATAAEICPYSGTFAFDLYGNLFFGNSNFTICTIRKIDTNGIITTITGLNLCGQSGDGGIDTLAMMHPASLSVDRIGNIYLSDNNSLIRKIDTDHVITTIAGTGVAGFSGDGGPATAAELYAPQGLINDSIGNLYFADYTNRIRKIDTAGIISTIAGNGGGGFSGDGGPSDSAKLYRSGDVAVLPNGDFYIADAGNNRVRKVHYIPESIKSTEAVYQFHIYPNPTGREGFTLVFTDKEGLAQINITNMEGALIEQLIAPTAQPLQLKLDAPAGVYFVHVVTQAGSWVQKVVME